MKTKLEKLRERCKEEGIVRISVSLDESTLPASEEEVLSEVLEIMDAVPVPDPDLF